MLLTFFKLYNHEIDGMPLKKYVDFAQYDRKIRQVFLPISPSPHPSYSGGTSLAAKNLTAISL